MALRHAQGTSAWSHAVSLIIDTASFVGLVFDLEACANARADMTMLHLATILTAVVCGSLVLQHVIRIQLLQQLHSSCWVVADGSLSTKAQTRCVLLLVVEVVASVAAWW